MSFTVAKSKKKNLSGVMNTSYLKHFKCIQRYFNFEQFPLIYTCIISL